MLARRGAEPTWRAIADRRSSAWDAVTRSEKAGIIAVMTERGLPTSDGAPGLPLRCVRRRARRRSTSPDHRHRCFAEIASGTSSDRASGGVLPLERIPGLSGVPGLGAAGGRASGRRSEVGEGGSGGSGRDRRSRRGRCGGRGRCCRRHGSERRKPGGRQVGCVSHVGPNGPHAVVRPFGAHERDAVLRVIRRARRRRRQPQQRMPPPTLAGGHEPTAQATELTPRPSRDLSR